MATLYKTHERALLDWASDKVSDPVEMGKIAPLIAQSLNRTECAIRKQIEERKKAKGHREFFWANT
ncbi:hypothetical protein [Paenibacillus sophorae]|uniref:Uncharacterized protein n=1 Tax=Paenibacillus sophorae TaxID=1333845 RepID=A0ABX8H801_9BACL|nr:hypothetical protein [Paenibacillus sophorae]QWU14325.1 hypothetical protein KP014_20680 [Paenibacillus sophorae]